MIEGVAVRRAYQIAQDIERLQAVIDDLVLVKQDWLDVAVDEGKLTDESFCGTITYDLETEQFSVCQRLFPWNGGSA